MTQVAIAIFGLTALWLAFGKSATGIKFAPVVGLAGQPFWLYETWGKWGMFALTIAYTVVFIRGAFVQWGYE